MEEKRKFVALLMKTSILLLCLTFPVLSYPETE